MNKIRLKSTASFKIRLLVRKHKANFYLTRVREFINNQNVWNVYIYLLERC